MIAALDVHYSGTEAHAAALLFESWRSEEPIVDFGATESPVAEYHPGRLYMRELAPLLKVISLIDRDVDTLVIDGYCHLSSDLTPGLGAHLHDALRRPVSIVGVAKNRYQRSKHAVEVLRANSARPLFVTAIGIDYEVAGGHIQSMAGPYRIPTLLKAVDRLARDGSES